MSKYTVAIAGDNHFFPGLLVSALSIILSNQKSQLQYYILDGGITDRNWESLCAICSNFPQIQGLHRVKITKQHLEGLSGSGEITQMAFARLYLGSIVDEDSVLYVDSDMLITKNLTELPSLISSEDIVYAVAEKSQSLIDETPWYAGEPDVNRSTKTFNSGFLWVNLRKWREEGLEPTLLEEARRHSHQCKLADQNIINWVLRNRIQQLDDSWNAQTYMVSKAPMDYQPGDSNIHFAGGFKPWLRPLPILPHDIRRRFYDKALVPLGANAVSIPFRNRQYAFRSARPSPSPHLEP